MREFLSFSSGNHQAHGNHHAILLEHKREPFLFCDACTDRKLFLKIDTRRYGAMNIYIYIFVSIPRARILIKSRLMIMIKDSQGCFETHRFLRRVPQETRVPIHDVTSAELIFRIHARVPLFPCIRDSIRDERILTLFSFSVIRSLSLSLSSRGDCTRLPRRRAFVACKNPEKLVPKRRTAERRCSANRSSISIETEIRYAIRKEIFHV